MVVESAAAAEYDGPEWHSTPEQQRFDRIRRADAAAQSYRIAVFTKKDVFESGGRRAEDKIRALRRAVLAQAHRRAG